MKKEEYEEYYENLYFDFWSLDVNGKVERLNELISENYETDEVVNLNIFINKWNLRCGKLLLEYDRFLDKDGIESPEKFMISRFLNNEQLATKHPSPKRKI